MSLKDKFRVTYQDEEKVIYKGSDKNSSEVILRCLPKDRLERLVEIQRKNVDNYKPLRKTQIKGALTAVVAFFLT